MGLIIFTPPPDQKLYKYGSKDMDSVVRRVKAANGPVESVHNADVRTEPKPAALSSALAVQ